MDLNEETSDEEDAPVVAAPAAYPQHAAAEPNTQPAEQPEEAMLQAHMPGEAATGIEEAEQLVAAAEAVVVKQEVEGTEDAVVAAEVIIKQEAAKPGTADGKRRGLRHARLPVARPI